MSAAVDQFYDLLRAEAEWQKYNRIHSFYPDDGPFARDMYPKHMELFRHSAVFRHLALFGGNGAGKTTFGAFFTALHATGMYPDWWPGRVFESGIDGWVAGKSKETVRDITQSRLIGNVAQHGMEAFGTGMIPKDRIVDYKFIQNTNKACDFVVVRSDMGSDSVIQFKSYDQRRKAFEGSNKHWIWLDEEPPRDVYSECVMRGRTVDGQLLLTFTPLEGWTDVVRGFKDAERNNAEQKGSQVLVTVGMDDVPHLSEEEKNEMLAAVPSWEREARRFGIPIAGAGKVYPVNESDFVVPPIAPIPGHWRRVGGFDGGWYNTAAVWVAYDKDNDFAYVYGEYKRGEVDVPVHAAAMKKRGVWIPFVGDAAAVNQGNGDKIIELYKKQGVRMRLAEKAVDAGIQEVLTRLLDGRLKISSTCTKLIEELRSYSYDENGAIRKQDDHLADALRYAIYGGLKYAAAQRVERASTTEEMTFGL